MIFPPINEKILKEKAADSQPLFQNLLGKSGKDSLVQKFLETNAAKKVGM